MKNTLFKAIILASLAIVASGCSSFTSIERQEDGKFIITGWETPGPVGFLMIGEYDPSTRTLTVTEKRE